MKKYIIRTLLFGCILLAFLPVLCKAQATGGYIVASGTYGDNLTWTLDNFGKLTVSGVGDMADYSTYPWDREGDPWMDLPIQSVVIEPGVTSISYAAFAHNYSLTSVTLPETITKIDSAAFMNCHNLASINIPASVSSIGQQAFYACHSLTAITLPEKLTSIERYVFYGCFNLTAINIPHGVTSIGAHAFEVCSNLTEINIPKSVTSIGEYAFDCCNSLVSISIPEGVTALWSHTFYRCRSLRSISIPRSVTAIYYDVFVDCDRLTDVYFNGNKAQWTAIESESGWGNDTLFAANLHTNETPFVDVSPKDYYYDPIVWALSEQITTGMSATAFAPDATCTRGQVVTFLWRASGSPEPASADNPFTDVPADAWYTDAVLWAVEKGITTGMSETTFAPDASCTRGQVATFLHRAQDKPACDGENIFTDIASGAYYYDAVLWAVAEGITNGMGDGTFAPDATCTRGQIVTFLFRALA